MIRQSYTPAETGPHDICVVGAGPVGLAIALRLSDAGKRVLLLESGGDGEETSALRFAETDLVDPQNHARATDSVRRGLGGTSRVWGAGCTPYDPIDFEARDWLPNSGAPIGSEDLVPYESATCAYLGCGGPSFEDAGNLPNGPLRASHLIRFSFERDMGRKHHDRLAATPSLTVCLNTTVTGLILDAGAQTATGLSVLSQGEPQTIESPCIVLAGGGIENARLLLCAQQQHSDLLRGETGALGRYYMGHLSGAVARIHFRDMAAARAFAFLKDTSGAYFRRRITFDDVTQRAHRLLNTYFLPANFPLSDPGMGSGALSALHLGLSLRYRTTHYMRHFEPGYVETDFHPGLCLGSHLGNMVRDPIGLATGLTSIARDRVTDVSRKPAFHYDNPRGVYALNYHAEQAPNPDSRVTLSDRLDTNGIPLPKVDLRFSDADIASVIRAHEVLEPWLIDNYLGHLSWLQEPERRVSHVWSHTRDGYHQIGLTRMSDTAAAGVVDRNLAVHDVGGLYIAGTGVLPTGSQAHPTFTAVAMGLRLSDHLLDA